MAASQNFTSVHREQTAKSHADRDEGSDEGPRWMCDTAPDTDPLPSCKRLGTPNPSCHAKLVDKNHRDPATERSLQPNDSRRHSRTFAVLPFEPADDVVCTVSVRRKSRAVRQS